VWWDSIIAGSWQSWRSSSISILYTPFVRGMCSTGRDRISSLINKLSTKSRTTGVTGRRWRLSDSRIPIWWLVIRDPGTRELEKVGVYITLTPPMVPVPEITEGEPSAIAIVPELGVAAVRESMYEELEIQGILAPVSIRISLTLLVRGMDRVLEVEGLRVTGTVGKICNTLCAEGFCLVFLKS
jgi:hypothetical protein